MRKIWIVEKDTGSYSDRNQETLRAHETREGAEAYALELVKSEPAIPAQPASKYGRGSPEITPDWDYHAGEESSSWHWSQNEITYNVYSLELFS